jgi:hypothetical protein
MNWTHRVDPVWLAARKDYLSASDVKKLIPATATGRPRANMEEAFLKVWADKQCLIDENDICSTGVMARGHLLEPYAIAEFNKIGLALPELHHWDDALIHSTHMACSPDAVDVVQPDNNQVTMTDPGVKFLGEVKAYNAGMHYACGLSTAKLTLEERWQLAVAFYIMPGLETAALIMFNPSAAHPLFYHLYHRPELVDELAMIEQVSRDYQTYMTAFLAQADLVCPGVDCMTEEAIIAEITEKQDIAAGLNP